MREPKAISTKECQRLTIQTLGKRFSLDVKANPIPETQDVRQKVPSLEPIKVLILGGSGFVSGTLARLALDRNYQVTVVTRGKRPLPAGVKSLTADRTVAGELENAMAGTTETYDLVVDCIGYTAADAEQDIRLFAERCGRLVFISTDFVFAPDRRAFPQCECGNFFLEDDSYGANKRRAEVEFFKAGERFSAWTIMRPCHIYGPGSQLGCLPCHGRDKELIDRLRRGEPLRLVGAGKFLQQPILARDLAETILSCLNAPRSRSQIYQCAGPDIVESVEYYRILASLLGQELHVEEIPVLAYQAEHPEHRSFLCHRIYSLHKLAADGLAVPATALADGLKIHLDSMLA